MKKYIALTVIVSGTAILALSAMSDQKPAPAPAPAKAPAARPVKIAVMEPQAIIAQSEEWRDKAAEVQQEFEKRANDLRKQREELAKTVRAAEAANDRSAIKDIAKKKNDLDIEEQSLSQDFQQRQQEMQVAIAQKIDVAVEAVAKAAGWDAVMPRFFYAAKDIDITTYVAEELNKEYRKEKAAKKFKKDNGSRPTNSIDKK